MKNSFTVVVLLVGISVGTYSLIFGKPSAMLSNDRHVVLNETLRVDCDLLLKEAERVQVDLEQYSLELQNFSVQFGQIQGNGNDAGLNKFLNRALVWLKTVNYSIDGHLKLIERLYQNCTCAAGKIDLSSDSQSLLTKTQQKYNQVHNRCLGLKKALGVFKNKIKPKLN